MSLSLVCGVILLASAFLVTQGSAQQIDSALPQPNGILVDLGGHRLHVDCRGKGAPTVIVENGFEEFSFDWTLVQSRVAKFTRICTYDRAGYAWSDAGPAPRTFDQINVELHDALAKLAEHGPFVLVGHSFGGPIVRNFAMVHPEDVAGIVFVDSVSEDQRFEMWHKAVLMRDGAKGNTIPSPHQEILPGDKLADSQYFNAAEALKLNPPFDRLSRDLRELHVWAQSQRLLAATEENERTWSPEYFARWHNHPEPNPLGSIPLIVLTREHGGFHDLDIPGMQQEAERNTNQRRLAALSKISELRIVASGEDMQVEAPDAVVQAIQDAVNAGHRNSHGQPKSK
jgi:pimeloyl-ACP methyl ester carboxylesterase